MPLSPLFRVSPTPGLSQPGAELTEAGAEVPRGGLPQFPVSFVSRVSEVLNKGVAMWNQRS